jgi:hypothetical protein
MIYTENFIAGINARVNNQVIKKMRVHFDSCAQGRSKLLKIIFIFNLNDTKFLVLLVNPG